MNKHWILAYATRFTNSSRSKLKVVILQSTLANDSLRDLYEKGVQSPVGVGFWIWEGVGESRRWSYQLLGEWRELTIWERLRLDSGEELYRA